MTDNTPVEFVDRALVDGKDANRWSVSYVRNLIAEGSQEEALTFIDVTAKSVVADDAVVAKRDGAATIKAALATYLAIVEGVIADGSGSSAVMTKGKYAEKFGRAQSLVSRWINLGYALVECEIDPAGEYTMKDQTFPLWMVLSSKGGADKKSVSALLRQGATADAVIEALSEFYGPDGKPVRNQTASTPRLRASSSKSDGTAEVTDSETGKTETLDVSKNAVRLALELAEVLRNHKAEGINRLDMGIIRDTLTPLLAVDGADDAETDAA